MLSPERIDGLPVRVVALLAQVWSRVKEMSADARDYFGVEMAERAVITNEVALEIVGRHYVGRTIAPTDHRTRREPGQSVCQREHALGVAHTLCLW